MGGKADTDKPRTTGERLARTKAKLEQVALLAGVGIATVDRVLNERGNVSPETARKVIDAARRLELPRRLPAPYRHGLRFDVLLTRPDTPFFGRLNRAFINVAATLDRSVIIQRSFVDESRPQAIAERVLATKSNAVIVYGPEHESVIDAVASVTAAGTPVVTLVTDIPTSSRLAYVGIDQYAAGRTAAYFMACMARRANPLIVLCNSLAYRAHAQRVSGFRDRLNQFEPKLSVGCVLEGRDDHTLSEDVVTDALRRFPQTAGIYNTGAGNRGVELALRTADLAGKVPFIGHELTVHTKRMLSEGVMMLAIDQNPEQQARRTVDILLRHFGYVEDTGGTNEIAFVIYGPENMNSLASL